MREGEGGNKSVCTPLVILEVCCVVVSSLEEGAILSSASLSFLPGTHQSPVESKMEAHKTYRLIF